MSCKSNCSPSRGSCFFALSAYDTSVSRRSSSGSDSNRLMILFSLAGYMGMKIYRGFPPCHSGRNRGCNAAAEGRQARLSTLLRHVPLVLQDVSTSLDMTVIGFGFAERRVYG